MTDFLLLIGIFQPRGGDFEAGNEQLSSRFSLSKAGIKS